MNSTLEFLINEERMAQAHKVNRENGWWEPTPAKAPLVLKIIEEVGELIEALSKEQWAKNLPYSAIQSPYFAGRYRDLVKGSVEEELADIVIRVWDYMMGFQLKFECNEDEIPGFETSVSIEEIVTLSYNFRKRELLKKDRTAMSKLELIALALSAISQRVNDIIKAILIDDGVTPMGDSPYEQDNAFPAILGICGFLAELCDVDIEHHVLLKVAYNSTRSHRHGGKKF